jgi:hypothetical protein
MQHAREFCWESARATVWFQQDGATSHTARMRVHNLREMFQHRLLSRFRDLIWQPYLLICKPQAVLWGYLKSRVFETRPATLDGFKASIREAIHGVLQRLMKMPLSTSRVQHCGMGRGPFTVFCFEKWITHNFQCFC